MAIEKFKPDADKDLYVYGEQANVEYFLGTQTPLASGAAANKTLTITSHQRKRFYGDTTPSTVSGHSRVILVDPGAKNGNSLPGKPFIVDELDENGEPIPSGETRQFTYVGAFRDLHAVFVGGATKDCWLISPAGKKYKIDAA